MNGDFENKARDFEKNGNFEVDGDFENKARDFEGNDNERQINGYSGFGGFNRGGYGVR